MAGGTNSNYLDVASWRPEVEGDSSRRSTEWNVKRIVQDGNGPSPDLSDSEAIEAAVRQAYLDYGGGTPSLLATGSNPYQHLYANAPLADYNVEMVGVFQARVTLVYQWQGQNSSATGESNLSIRSSAGLETVEVKQGLANRYVLTAEKKPVGDEWDRVLNPNIEGVSQGAQLSVPVVRFSYRFRLSYEEAKNLWMYPIGATTGAIAWDVWSNAYEEVLLALTGRVNLVDFAGRPAGTVRFDGGSGEVNDLGEMDFSWDFTRRSLNVATGLPDMYLRRVAGQEIGEGSAPSFYDSLLRPLVTGTPSWGSLDKDDPPLISNVGYDEWDSLSMIYDTIETDDGVELVPRIKAASAVQAIPRADLNYLRIPGITPVVPAPS